MTGKTLSANVLDTFSRLMEWKTIPMRTEVAEYKEPKYIGTSNALRIRENINFSYENDGTDDGSNEWSLPNAVKVSLGWRKVYLTKSEALTYLKWWAASSSCYKSPIKQMRRHFEAEDCQKTPVEIKEMMEACPEKIRRLRLCWQEQEYFSIFCRNSFYEKEANPKDVANKHFMDGVPLRPGGSFEAFTIDFAKSPKTEKRNLLGKAVQLIQDFRK